MSEEKGKGYCRWCDTQTNAIIQERENGRLIWVGCSNCYVKKKELEQENDEKK